MLFKKYQGLFFAAATMGALASGCSSSNSDSTPTTDAGQKNDSSVTQSDSGGGSDAKSDAKPVSEAGKPDTGTQDDGGATQDDDTVGKACAGDDDCEKVGDVDKVCSNGAYSLGSLYPDPICLGACTAEEDPNAKADASIADRYLTTSCDNNRGWCQVVSSSPPDGNCSPRCDLKDGAASATGCVGTKAACSLIGSVDDTTATGTCEAACTADSDCTKTAGEVCLKEFGYCATPAWIKDATKGLAKNYNLNTAQTALKSAIGSACKRSDSAKEDCICFAKTPAGSATTDGFCSGFCSTGSNVCGTGYKCSALFAKQLANDGGAGAFTTEPTGVQGYCVKECTQNSDCTAYGADFECDKNVVGLTGACLTKN